MLFLTAVTLRGEDPMVMMASPTNVPVPDIAISSPASPEYVLIAAVYVARAYPEYTALLTVGEAAGKETKAASTVPRHVRLTNERSFVPSFIPFMISTKFWYKEFASAFWLALKVYVTAIFAIIAPVLL
jgi:hypothetical protein